MEVRAMKKTDEEYLNAHNMYLLSNGDIQVMTENGEGVRFGEESMLELARILREHAYLLWVKSQTQSGEIAP